MFTLSASRLQKSRPKPLDARRTFSTTSPSGSSSEKADQRRRAFSTATSLDLDTPYRAQRRPCFAFRSRLATDQCRQAQPSEKAFRSKSANRYSFDLFRSTVFVRWGPRLSPCPPQPLGAMLRALSRRPSGRFRDRKLVVLAPHSKLFFGPPECVWIMTKPTAPGRGECPQGRPWPVPRVSAPH